MYKHFVGVARSLCFCNKMPPNPYTHVYTVKHNVACIRLHIALILNTIFDFAAAAATANASL